ncbi:MAG: NADH-quinone oxidoreductase subunit L [Promethearchaeota archaeon]
MTDLIFGNLAFLIPIIPILAAFFAIFFGKFLDKKAHGNIIALMALGTSLILTIIVSGEVILRLLFLNASVEEVTMRDVIEWFHVGGVSLDIGILLDPLTAVVSLMVALISFLVVVYSRSYMAHDGSPRYYAEINLFAAAMLGLCLSPNFIQFFLFWEIMGVCSYLLIGYYYDKELVPEGQPHPASAAKKAFLTTKVGDVFLFMAIILLWLETHTIDFIELRNKLEEGTINIEPMLFFFIVLFIFAGAVGKSAQFPLHVWLPDAMAGPTTVSCLIHSATMVKAGIFLVARTYFLFEHVHEVIHENTLLVVALIGGITAILAGTIAIVKTDIKGILAYSTISQLGYMTIGLGVGGMAVSIFHVINHGIFKALLFLSAGSVIHGSGTQDIREMGGLKEKMPHTWKVMLIGSLSITGIGNGFFSKDAIILHALHRWQDPSFSIFHNQLVMIVWLSAVVTAFVTAFYMFRLWFLVFPGKNRLPESEIHESDRWMITPLWILGIISLGMAAYYTIGLFNTDLSFEHDLIAWLEGTHVYPLPFNWNMAFITLILSILGIALAYLIYYPRADAQISFPKDEPSFYIDVAEPDNLAKLQRRIRSFARKLKLTIFGLSIQRILENGYYIDDLYLIFVYFINAKFCSTMNWIEENIFDGAVRLVGKVGYELCSLSKWWDEYVVEGLVNSVAQASYALCGFVKVIDERVIDHGIIRNSAKRVMKTGGYLRRIQTGVVENYAFYTLLGAIFLILAAIYLVGG